MSKKFYVYSTLTSGMDYTGYLPGGADLPTTEKVVHLNGGANLADKHLVTPRGVVTLLDEAEVEFLRNHPVFQLHQKNGFVTIEAKQAEPEVVAANMTGRDKSAPLVDQDFEEKVTEDGERVSTAPKSNGAPVNRRRA